MKTKLLLTALLLSAASFAQDSTFHIKDFKFRTPRYRALALAFDVSGSTGHSRASNENKVRNFGVSPSGVSYVSLVSTDDVLRQTYLFTYTSGGYTKSQSGGLVSKNNSVRGQLFFSSKNQYFSRGNRFLETGAEAESFNTSDRTTTSAKENRDVTNDIKLALVLGIGKGRLEQVQDAQLAAYILSDLKAQGLLSKALTTENSFAFAQLVTRTKNRRVLDFRRRRIYELTQIDSFLRATGLITNPDIRHFTTINDNWAFALTPPRLSGTSWYFRLKPGISYDHSKRSENAAGANNSSLSKQTSLLITPVAGIERHVPQSLRWQVDMGASVSYEGLKGSTSLRFKSPGNINISRFSGYESQYRFDGFYGVGFFPNSRTQLLAKADVSVAYNAAFAWQYVANVQAYANYFLSYRAYLSAGYALNYNYLDYRSGIATVPNPFAFSTSFSVGLNYQLF